MYDDRSAAGAVLCERLLDAGIRPDVVLGVPPGGTTVARNLASCFDADLGVTVARPMRTPGDQNLPVGAVTATGEAWVDDERVRAFDVDEERLDAEQQRAFSEARNRYQMYEEVGETPARNGTVAIVDEGIVSATELSACVSAVDATTDGLVVAVAPVGVPDAVATLQTVADDVFVDETTSKRRVLERHYEHFEQSVPPQQSPDE